MPDNRCSTHILNKEIETENKPIAISISSINSDE